MGEDEDTLSDGDTETAVQPAMSATHPRQAEPTDNFGWRGWLLVVMIVVSFLLIPGLILVLPEAQGFISGFGLTLRDAYLVLPLPAAIFLGAIAVWSALAARKD